MQKEITNQAFWLVNDQRNSQMANQIFCFQIKRTGSCNFVSLWKNYSCLFIPNCTRNHVITYTNSIGLFGYINIQYFIFVFNNTHFLSSSTRIILFWSCWIYRCASCGILQHLTNHSESREEIILSLIHIWRCRRS